MAGVQDLQSAAVADGSPVAVMAVAPVIAQPSAARLVLRCPDAVVSGVCGAAPVAAAVPPASLPQQLAARCDAGTPHSWRQWAVLPPVAPARDL